MAAVPNSIYIAFLKVWKVACCIVVLTFTNVALILYPGSTPRSRPSAIIWWPNYMAHGLEMFRICGHHFLRCKHSNPSNPSGCNIATDWTTFRDVGPCLSRQWFVVGTFSASPETTVSNFDQALNFRGLPMRCDFSTPVEHEHRRPLTGNKSGGPLPLLVVFVFS